MQFSEQFRKPTCPPNFKKKIHKVFLIAIFDVNVILLTFLFIYRLGAKTKRFIMGKNKNKFLFILLIINNKNRDCINLI